MDNTKLEGATTPPNEGTEVADAGEFAAHWNSLDQAGREDLVTSIKFAGETAFKCVIGDHTDSLTHLSSRLEAAEAELTRRDTVIEQIRSGVARRLDQDWDDTQSTDTDVWRALEWIDGLIADHREDSAAAPVSLEAVKAETTCDRGYVNCDVCSDGASPSFETGRAVGYGEAMGEYAATVEATTTTEWALITQSPIPFYHASSLAAAEDARKLWGDSTVVTREVTEWRPVETEGETK